MNPIKYFMSINKVFFLFLLFSVFFVSCSSLEDDVVDPKPTQSKDDLDEFESFEILFDEEAFSDPKSVELLKEINICSDIQTDEKGKIVTPCSPKLFKFFPLQEGKPLEEGFVLLVKAETGGFALRRVLVFERENGSLVKVNGFIANLIATKKKKGTNDDLLLRFIDKIDGSDVFYHCIFTWESGKYEFKTIEVIHEPSGNFHRRVKESAKDSLSKEIFKILEDNQMIF
jgi:hypothetical protein